MSILLSRQIRLGDFLEPVEISQGFHLRSNILALTVIEDSFHQIRIFGIDCRMFRTTKPVLQMVVEQSVSVLLGWLALGLSQQHGAGLSESVHHDVGRQAFCVALVLIAELLRFRLHVIDALQGVLRSLLFACESY